MPDWVLKAVIEAVKQLAPLLLQLVTQWLQDLLKRGGTLSPTELEIAGRLLACCQTVDRLASRLQEKS